MSGAEVVVLGNTGDIGDDVVVAGAVAAGVPVIIVDMPNSEARLHPGHTLAVAPSHATGATVEAIMQRLHGEGVRGPNELPGGARAAHGELAKAWRRPCQGVPPVAVVNPGADVARFSLRHPAATRARRASHECVHVPRVWRAVAGTWVLPECAHGWCTPSPLLCLAMRCVPCRAVPTKRWWGSWLA